MGYRSDVAIQCEEKVFNGLLNLKNAGVISFEKVQKSLDGIYTLSWNWVKWYEDFDDVIAINSYLESIKEEHPDEEGYSFFYIRIGEEYGDIEEQSNGHNTWVGYSVHLDLEYLGNEIEVI